MNQKGSVWIVIFVIVLMTLAIGGGLYWAQTINKKVSPDAAVVHLKQISDVEKIADQTQDISNWKTYSDPQKIYSFQYPSNWEVLDEVPQNYKSVLFDPSISGWKLEDWLNSKMFTDKCRGPILRNTKVDTTLIAFEIVEKNRDGGFCWSNGDFTTKYKRTIKIQTSSYQVDVIKWRLGDYAFPVTKDNSGQKYSPEWKGDLFQQMSIPTQNSKYNAFAALVYKDGTDDIAEQVYDQIISTFKFN